MCITVKQMMQIEENGHQMGFLRKFMMENAGAGATKRLVEKFGDVKSKNALVFAGLGNNGGDGLVIARHLAGYGSSVTVFLLGEPDNIRSEECSWNWNLLEKMKSIKLLTGGNFELLNNLDKFDIIIDGILGTGISGEIREPQASAITFINKSNAFKLAVDVPSGVDPDTGNKNLPHVTANITVTFHRMKVGMQKQKMYVVKFLLKKLVFHQRQRLVFYEGVSNSSWPNAIFFIHC